MLRFKSLLDREREYLMQIEHLKKLKTCDLSKFHGKKITIRINRHLDRGKHPFRMYRGQNGRDFHIQSIEELDGNRYVDFLVYDVKSGNNFVFNYSDFLYRVSECIKEKQNCIVQLHNAAKVYDELKSIKKYLNSKKFDNLPFNFKSEVIGAL